MGNNAKDFCTNLALQNTIMKKLLGAILLVSQISTAQQADVRKTIDTFFEGFHQKDTIKMKSVLGRGMVLHSVTEGKDGPQFSMENAAQFYKSIASIPQQIVIEEKLQGYEIKTDGNMAHAWTPYAFYVNGKLSHTGVNSFQLFKDAEGWKIVYCIDTRRKPQ